MNYQNRRKSRIKARQNQGTNLMRFCWFLTGVFFVATILTGMDLAATYDIIEAEQAESMCAEMVELYEATDGDLGWPNCDHLLS